MSNSPDKSNWEEIEEALFDLHIRFCPLVDKPDSKIKQSDCNEHKEELRQRILNLLHSELQRQAREIIDEIPDKFHADDGIRFVDVELKLLKQQLKDKYGIK